jgi:hypothetical protein
MAEINRKLAPEPMTPVSLRAAPKTIGDRLAFGLALVRRGDRRTSGDFRGPFEIHGDVSASGEHADGIRRGDRVGFCTLIGNS